MIFNGSSLRTFLFKMCNVYKGSKIIINSSSRYITGKPQLNLQAKMFKFSNYDCIGFDLDNTLARYKVGNMIEMEYRIISNFLVKQRGYSEELLQKPFDHNFIIRGLIVDDENGNLIRIAPDGTVIQATHGTKFLSEDEIMKYYPNKHWAATDLFIEDPLQTWNGPYSEKMRTLLDYFDIVVSLVYGRAIDLIDKMHGQRKMYGIWPDLLDALVYMFNRDHFQKNVGEYFPELKRNPEKYYYKCSNTLLQWLNDLKSSGKHLFLITGSHVDSATHTANNTIGANWRDFFDIVICYAKKPGFFTMKRDFIGWNDFEESGPVSAKDLKRGEIYTHGNWTELREFMRSLSSVEHPKVLYVGDNLVQDVYTPHVHSNCDTVAVCEELEAEKTIGFEEKWHPDEQFLCSTVWGSYFHCNSVDVCTNWFDMMKKHSKLCIPSLEYVANFPVDQEFDASFYYT